MTSTAPSLSTSELDVVAEVVRHHRLLAMPYLNRVYDFDQLVEGPALWHISTSDFATIVAFWSADEALIDSDLAYSIPHPDPDDESCDCWTHSPHKRASGELFDLVLRACIPGALVNAFYGQSHRAIGDDVVERLVAVGIRPRS